MTLPDTIVGRLIANDVMLPGQWWTKRETRTPEERLLSAMLDDAFRRLRAANIVGKETRSWFRSRCQCWGSFEFVCEVLRIDPTTYRRAAWTVWRSRIRMARIIRRGGFQGQQRIGG